MKLLEAAQNDLTTINTEKNSLVSKVIQLNRTIDETAQKMQEEKEQINVTQKKLNKDLLTTQKDKESLEERLKMFKGDASEQSKKYDAILEEKVALVTMVEECTNKIGGLQESMTKLQDENKGLIESCTNKEQEKEQLKEILKETNEELSSALKEKSSLQERLEKLENNITEQRKEHDALAEEKVALLDKVEECSKNIEVLQGSLTKAQDENQTLVESCSNKEQEKEQLQGKLNGINEELSSALKDKDSLQEQLTKLESDATQQRKEYDALAEEKDTLVMKVEECTKNVEELQGTLTKLKEENKILIESSTNKEQLIALNEQLVRMEKTHNEKVDLWKKEKESLIQDVKICRAKLMKERESAEQKEKEFKAMRNAFEEKLDKMKEKMVSSFPLFLSIRCFHRVHSISLVACLACKTACSSIVFYVAIC